MTAHQNRVRLALADFLADQQSGEPGKDAPVSAAS